MSFQVNIKIECLLDCVRNLKVLDLKTLDKMLLILFNHWLL